MQHHSHGIDTIALFCIVNSLYAEAVVGAVVPAKWWQYCHSSVSGSMTNLHVGVTQRDVQSSPSCLFNQQIHGDAAINHPVCTN